MPVENPLFGQTFPYHKEDFSSGLEWAKQELASFREDTHSDVPSMRDFARQAIPSYEQTVEYMISKSPSDMLEEYRLIVNRVNQLEIDGADRLTIGMIIRQEFGQTPNHYRVILRMKRGGHKSLGQVIDAATIESASKT
ncbi:hypothetical protein HY408_01660 [Candidatus Gottesmanbacteria bacterium]|nr:hypothetical protein [Candidatus Gottesmanbacteria bacterium]